MTNNVKYELKGKTVSLSVTFPDVERGRITDLPNSERGGAMSDRYSSEVSQWEDEAIKFKYATVLFQLHNSESHIEYMAELHDADGWHYAVMIASHGSRYLRCEWTSPVQLTFHCPD